MGDALCRSEPARSASGRGSSPTRAVATLDSAELEGRDLLDPAADVFVPDGFTGNVVLKTSRTASAVAAAGSPAARSGCARVPRLLLRPSLGSLRGAVDPDTTAARSCWLRGSRSSATLAVPRGIANQSRWRAGGLRAGRRADESRSNAPGSAAVSFATIAASVTPSPES